jgi:hypothetical protein
MRGDDKNIEWVLKKTGVMVFIVQRSNKKDKLVLFDAIGHDG